MVTTAVGPKKPVPNCWSNTIMALATNGPTDAMNRILAMTIIQTTMGISQSFMPGVREPIVVVMKLIPPIKKPQNKRYRDHPQGRAQWR